MSSGLEPKKCPSALLKRLAIVLVLGGIVIVLFGWHWGRLCDFTWKGNLDYPPRNTEEIPRPFEQVFENYVEDQWPFVIMAGTVFVAVGGLRYRLLLCAKHTRTNHYLAGTNPRKESLSKGKR
jgi:hypothetical protein